MIYLFTVKIYEFIFPRNPMRNLERRYLALKIIKIYWESVYIYKHNQFQKE